MKGAHIVTHIGPPRVLTGRELRVAADKRLHVRVVEKDRGHLRDTIAIAHWMTSFPWYIRLGMLSINRHDYPPDCLVTDESRGDFFAVYAVPGIKYSAGRR